MHSILDIITGTPWWVWFLLAYLIIVGIKAIKPRVVSWQKLIIMPLIFLFWSINSAYNKYGPSFYVFSFLFLFLLIGLLIGWHITKRGISIDKNTQLIHLRGSWFPLIFSMLFFAVKYIVGVTLAIKPEMRSYAPLWLTDTCLSGLITGISWSRFLHIVQRLNK